MYLSFCEMEGEGSFYFTDYFEDMHFNVFL